MNKKRLFPNQVGEQRKKRGLTQAELAAILGTNQFSISAYEKGETLPNLTSFCKLAAALNTPALTPFFYPELDRECREEMTKRRNELDIQLKY